jgi:hypothetical protein
MMSPGGKTYAFNIYAFRKIRDKRVSIFRKDGLTELVENPRLAAITSGTKSAGRALLVSTNFTD